MTPCRATGAILGAFLLLIARGAQASGDPALSEAQEMEGPSRPVASGLAYAGALLPVLAAFQADDLGEAVLPVGVGLVFGPSLGQFYARAPWHGLLGAGLRVGGGYLLLAGLVEGLGQGRACARREQEGSECAEGERQGDLLVLSGGVLLLGGTLYSIADAPRTVDRWRSRRRTAAYGVSPTLAPAAGGRSTMGARAWARF